MQGKLTGKIGVTYKFLDKVEEPGSGQDRSQNPQEPEHFWEFIFRQQPQQFIQSRKNLSLI